MANGFCGSNAAFQKSMQNAARRDIYATVLMQA
jgi:hypothetical protein